VLIAPVVVVELTTENNGPRRRIELLAGQAAMAEQVSQRNVASAEVLFETALGLCTAEKCSTSRDSLSNGWGSGASVPGGSDVLVAVSYQPSALRYQL